MIQPVDQAILARGAQGWTPVKSLLKEHRRSTVYRRLRRLVEAGHVERRGSDYRTSESGLLMVAPSTSEGTDGFNALWPPIADTPSPVHRAVVELLLAAIVDRENSTRTDHYAGFALIGRTLKWKSWLAHFVCVALGLDPVTHVVLTTSESGRSVFVRRGPTGTPVSERELLNARFIGLDEAHRAGVALRRLISVYLQGSKTIAFENETLTVRPTPLVIMNPLAGKSLSERTGYDDAQLRRMIVADLDAVEIGKDIATRGEEILMRARKHPPIRLDSLSPRGDVRRWREDVARLLEVTVDSKRMVLVDVEMIMGLVSGMTAFLEGDAAVRRVLADYLTILQTLEWTRPGWPAAIGSWRTPEAAGVEVPPSTGRDRSGDLRTEVRAIIAKSQTEAPSLDYNANLRSLKETLDDEGVTVDKVRQWITRERAFDERLGLDKRETERLCRELERVGGREGGKEVARLLARYGTLTAAVTAKTAERDALCEEIGALRTTRHTQRRAIAEMGGTIAGTHNLMMFKREIEWQTRQSAYSLIRYLSPAVALSRTGRDPDELTWLIGELSRDGGDPGATVERLRLLQAEYDRIETAMEEYRKDETNSRDLTQFLKDRLAGLFEENREWGEKLRKLKVEVGAQAAKCARREEELARKTEEVNGQAEEFSRIEGLISAKRDELNVLENRTARLDEDFRATEQFRRFLETGVIPEGDDTLVQAMIRIIRLRDRDQAQWWSNVERAKLAESALDRIAEMIARRRTGSLVLVRREEYEGMKATIVRVEAEGKDGRGAHPVQGEANWTPSGDGPPPATSP